MATVVGGDEKASFSIATTLTCRGGHDYFPWIAPLYPWYIPYIAECYAGRYQVPFLKSLVWRDLGLNLCLLDHWRTLYPLGQWAEDKKLSSCQQLLEIIQRWRTRILSVFFKSIQVKRGESRFHLEEVISNGNSSD